MEKIQSLRKKIDEIDEQILYSLKDRLKVCVTIGATKREDGIPIRDSQREEEQYRYIMKKASELELDPHEVKAVYRKIISMCIRAQETDTTKN